MEVLTEEQVVDADEGGRAEDEIVLGLQETIIKGASQIRVFQQQGNFLLDALNIIGGDVGIDSLNGVAEEI